MSFFGLFFALAALVLNGLALYTFLTLDKLAFGRSCMLLGCMSLMLSAAILFGGF